MGRTSNIVYMVHCVVFLSDMCVDDGAREDLPFSLCVFEEEYRHKWPFAKYVHSAYTHTHCLDV